MYHILYQRVLWPTYEALIKRRQTCKRWHLLDESQWWDAERLESFQNEELRKFLKHLHNNSQYFADVCGAKGLQQSDFRSKEAFLSLPIIDKDDIRTNLDAMRSKSTQGWVIEKSTGGSTGKPLHFVHDKVSYEWRIAAAFRAYAWAQCEDGRKTVYVWGGAIGDPSKAQTRKMALHQLLQRRKVFNSFYFDDAKMRECIEFIRRYKPSGVAGFTNPLCNMARLMKREGLAPLSVSNIVTAAEGVRDEQRELIEDMFGGRVFQTYGSREFMSIGAECEKHEGLHLASENLLVEIIKDGKPAAPGEVGDIVVTDLHNYAMPFVRYRTGDRGAMSEKPCSCGRGLPLMESVVGRELDILHTLDGREVPGEFFPHLMKEFKAVEQFQVVQKKRDLIEVRLQMRNAFGSGQEEFMKSEIRKVVGDATEVKLCYMDEIPLTLSGKHRVTISEIGRE